MELYADYGWREGKPYGKGKLFESNEGFLILSDPYKKRYTVEIYVKGLFSGIAYDSGLFDFRLLFRGEDASWQREILSENEDKVEALIRNMDERVVLREEMIFEKGACKSCHFYAPQGIYLGCQVILKNDPINGVVLYDATGRTIWQKEYAIDVASGAFSTLLKEITEF